MHILSRPSPNFDERSITVPRLLVFHYTDMRTAKEALDRLTDPESKVSAHYLIDEDGTIYRLVEDNKRAWHAGVSGWRGQANLNDESIGIELANPGHQYGYHLFPETQIKALIGLSKHLIEKYTIMPENIVGHSDIAPLRKKDPGELFPWQYLATQGIGLWPTNETMHTSSHCFLSQADIVYLLQEIGYPIPSKTVTNEHFATLVRAFQRRFAPQELVKGYTPDTEQRLLAVVSAYKNRQING